MQEFVFCLARGALQNVDIGGDEPSSFAKNDVFVARYSHVSDYVLNDSIVLI